MSPLDLLAALLEEAESRAVELLSHHGVSHRGVLADLEGRLEPAGAPTDESGRFGEEIPRARSAELRLVIAEATGQARAIDRNRPVGTEHLLAGLLAVPGPASDALRDWGVDPETLLEDLGVQGQADIAPLPVPEDIPPLELAGPAEAPDLARILDAAANRAGEGLRVAEDYIRFVLDDPQLTRRAKDIRHRLGEALRGLDLPGRIGHRDTEGDVGTHITTPTEQARENPRAVLAANFRRVAEALRSLEEYSKLIDVWLAGRFEVLRYDMYTLEKRTLLAVSSRHSLENVRLCVIVGGLPTLGDLTWVVGEALAGGAEMIQLREKGLNDREWLRRAREVRLLTVEAGAVFILNDRADLARLSGADGVHLGQDDLSIRDARRILGPRALIGVSTHDREQMDRALIEGAGYLGVGPVFSSSTKAFDNLAGLQYVRQAAEATTHPWFAIGGIDAKNVDAVLEAGAERIAVSSAVVHADRPRDAAATLRARIEAAV